MKRHGPLIGIMQGRLVPPVHGRIQAFPVERWSDEFALAGAAGVRCIEWIYELCSADDNPLGTEHGIARMLAAQAENGVIVESLCADLLMEEPLVRVTDEERLRTMDRFKWLLRQSASAGIRRVVLPFVDASAIRSEFDTAVVLESLAAALPLAEELGIELHLETALGPKEFRKLLDRQPHPLIKVNYDSGNSASLGYDPREELDAYGERIGSVHIKDRVLGGGTVPLGSGDADLPTVFEGLATLGYEGSFILQVARGEPGTEVDWARHNAGIVLDYLSRYGFISR